jgi:integrase
MKRDLAIREDEVIETVQAHLNSQRGVDGAELLMSLIVCDAILERRSLAQATSAAASSYRVNEHLRLAWTIDGWQDARYLCPSSVARIQHRGHIVGQPDWKQLEASLRKLAGVSIDELLSAAQAWWKHRLPNDLFLHATRLRPYQVLSRQTLARGQTALVLAKPHPSKSNDFLALRTVAKGASTQAKLRWLMDLEATIGRIARTRQAASSATREIRSAVNACARQAANCGLPSLLAWVAIDVLTSDIRSKALAPRTLVEYLRFVRLLQSKLNEQPNVETMDAESWQQVYESVIERLKPSQRDKCRAVFDHIHMGFVSCGFDWTRRLSSPSEWINVPRARILWKHEYDRALNYISTACSDPIVKQQSLLIIRLAWHMPLREDDILSIRCSDITEGIAGLTLSIAAPSESGGPKTRATRRNIDIPNGELADALREIHSRRHDESASDHHPLLSSRGLLKDLYRIEDTLRLVTAALREASGDSEITFYALRHTALTRHRLQIDDTGARIDLPVDAQMAEFAGHADLNSWVHYFHQPDDLLRLHCYEANRPWNAVSQPSACIALKPVTFGVSLTEPPSSLDIKFDVNVQRPRFSTYLAISLDLLGDMTMGQIESKYRMSNNSLTTYLARLIFSMPDFLLKKTSRHQTCQDRGILRVGLPWARSSEQKKLASLITYFDNLLSDIKFNEIKDLIFAWRTLRHPHHIELSDDRCSDDLLRHLLNAGLRNNLRLGCTSNSPALPESAQGLTRVHFERRADRPPCRLLITSGGSAKRGNGMSIIGLQWLFVVLAAAQMTEEAIRHE